MLPSEKAARILIRDGFAAALPGLATSIAKRTGLIAIGLRLAGQKKNIPRLSITAALVVEAAVIAFVYSQADFKAKDRLSPSWKPAPLIPRPPTPWAPSWKTTRAIPGPQRPR